MKLSDAMREADARGIPDARGKFIERSIRKWGGEIPPACAIGGANIVAGNVPLKFTASGKWLTDETVGHAADLLQNWSEIHLDTIRKCPACDIYLLLAGHGIPHLYDTHKFSRTQIADWLDEVLA